MEGNGKQGGESRSVFQFYNDLGKATQFADGSRFSDGAKSFCLYVRTFVVWKKSHQDYGTARISRAKATEQMGWDKRSMKLWTEKIEKAGIWTVTTAGQNHHYVYKFHDLFAGALKQPREFRGRSVARLAGASKQPPRGCLITPDTKYRDEEGEWQVPKAFPSELQTLRQEFRAKLKAAKSPEAKAEWKKRLSKVEAVLIGPPVEDVALQANGETSSEPPMSKEQGKKLAAQLREMWESEKARSNGEA